VTHEPAPRRLQQRVSTTILDAAAGVFAHGPTNVGMSDVASAGGVARATVYRYFPSREQLLDEIARIALHEIHERLVAARLDAVTTDEALRRSIRSLVESGDYFVVLVRERVRPSPADVDRLLLAPLRTMFDRADSDGELRPAIPASVLPGLLVSCVAGALQSPALGREDMISALASFVLEGIRRRDNAR
jgi:AcrR family transcriptional regulator